MRYIEVFMKSKGQYDSLFRVYEDGSIVGTSEGLSMVHNSSLVRDDLLAQVHDTDQLFEHVFHVFGDNMLRRAVIREGDPPLHSDLNLLTRAHYDSAPTIQM